MLLRRIEIRDFRKLSHIVIDDLADGLNVIVGDNEAGKSTLLAALRAVLFERHRVGGKVLDAMLPHGGDVRPEIVVDFELNGARWRLRKAFGQRPEAELTGPGPRLTGDAVEEKLAELLGFVPPGNRGSKPDEHQGVYGLLWIEQGQAHTPFDAGAGQDTLASALESEVGQVLGGERGRRLLARAEARRDTFWDKRDRPRGDHKGLQELIGAVGAQKAELMMRARVHDDKVAALAQRADILARHTREGRLAMAGRAVDAARRAVEAVGQLAATHASLRAAEARAGLEREAAAERLTQRTALAAKVEADRARAAASAEAAQAATTSAARAEAEARRAFEAAREARAGRVSVEDALHALERSQARRQAAETIERAAARLHEAEGVAAKRRDAMAEAAAITLTRDDVAGLDRLAADVDAARAKRDAASVQIGFEPLAGATVRVDGREHEVALPVRLARDAVLDLGGFGRLTIRPGGGAEALAQGVDAAERRLSDRLRQLGQPSRQEAVATLTRKLEAEREAAGHQHLFDMLAPAGLDALRLDLDRLRAAAGPPLGPDPAPATAQQIADARREGEAARAEERMAEAEATRLGATRETVSRDAAVLAERALAAARDHTAGSAALLEARARAPDTTLAATLAEAEQRLALAAAASGAAENALTAADPETAALELRRAEGAEKAIRLDIETLTRERRDLEVELRTLGQEGIGEMLAETEGRLALLRRQADAQGLEAQASLLLHRTLAQAQTETRDRWLGPVRDRVRPYLRLIQPDSEIVLNEKTFSIEHLVRGGVPEPFGSLSVGAREQVAVITRLALADILRGSGQPSAIILDDALVNTDETRLGRMHLVLQKAAQSLQILVLTCRERDFYDLGAPIRRL